MSSIFQSTKNTRAILLDSFRYIRSDVPNGLSDDEIKRLIDNDIRTIVDLREDTERQQKPCSLINRSELNYLCMPVTGGNAVPEKPDDVPLSYISMIDKRMMRIIDTLLNAETNCLYFCNAGKDRTGVVSALLLHRLGYGDEYIIADYLKSAENLKTVLEIFADSNPQIDIEVITPKREYMEILLRQIHKL